MAAFLSGAGNLILDEPFNGLDPESVAMLKNLLSEYRDRGNLVLFSIHNLDLVANFCDDIVFIDKQRKVFQTENPKDFKQLEDVFFQKCVWIKIEVIWRTTAKEKCRSAAYPHILTRLRLWTKQGRRSFIKKRDDNIGKILLVSFKGDEEKLIDSVISVLDAGREKFTFQEMNIISELQHKATS